jgi:hypothetical protein
MFVCNVFLSTCVSLMTYQVAVKSLLVYACDEVRGIMKKKSKVSTSVVRCVD